MSVDNDAVAGSSPGQVLDRVEEAIVGLDTDWQVGFANERAGEVLGCDPDAVLGESIWEAAPAVAGTELATELRRAVESGDPVQCEVSLDSTGRWYAVRAYPGSDGLTVCLDDVTDERETQLEIQRERRLFETVFEETNDALVVADSDRRITEFNPAAEQLFGYDAADAVGRKSAFLYADETDYERQGEERFNERAAERDDSYVVEYERADGTTFPGETVGTPLTGPEGETLAFLGAIRDASERLAYEHRIESRNEALRAFHEITTDPDRSFDDRLTAVLELGADHLGLDVGVLSTTDGSGCTVTHTATAEEARDQQVEPGETVGLDGTVRGDVADDGTLVSVAGAGESDVESAESNAVGAELDAGDTESNAVGAELDAGDAESDTGGLERPTTDGRSVEAYLGVPVVVDGDRYGVLDFSSSSAGREPFDESEKTFTRVVAQWVSEELRIRRETERARASRTRLRQIVDTLPQLVFAKDEAGEFLLANESLADAYGTTVAELEGATDADFANSAAEVEQFRTDDRAVIASGEPKHVPEEHLTTADGEQLILETTKIPYDPVETDGAAVLGVSTDITERKRREEELEVQSAAMEASMDGIAILDGDEYVYTNRAHADVFDYDPDDLVGTTWRMLYDDDEIERIEQEVLPELEREGEWRGETIGTRSDGSDVHQEITLSLLDDGTLICTNRDITERKRRERDLRELTERLDLAVEGANLGVWDWNVQTGHVTFNDQWAEMLGLLPDEVEPTLDTWEERVHPEDMPRVEQELNAHIDGDAELYDCDHRMQTASGDWKWVRDVGEVVQRTEDGDPVRAVGIHIDIDEQKSTQRQLEEERDMFARGPAVVFKWRNEEGWPVEYVSDNVTETLGYTPADLQSGDVPYAELIHDEDADRVAAEVERHTDGSTERFSHEPYRMVTGSGDVAWVRDNTKIVREDGAITHYLGYLVDITERKQREQSLRESERSLRRLTAIASDTDRGLEAKVRAALELGREYLGLPYGFLNRIDDGTQHVFEALGTHPMLQEGESAPLSQTYCRRTVGSDHTFVVEDAVEEGWENDPAYEAFGLGCYVGGTVTVDGDEWGTLCFAAGADQTHQFDETERAFVELLVQWISYELRGEVVEQKLRQLNETAQRLMTTTATDELVSVVTESATTVLDLPITGVWWYDDQSNALVPASMTDEASSVVDDQPTFEAGDSLAWRAFDDGAVRVYDDLQSVEGHHNPDTVLESEVIVPLGDHGVLLSGSTQQRAFSETDRSLLEVFGATIEEALDRTERERALRETREQLEQSNQELEQFAYAASHDLQEPLRTVSSYLTLLERRYRDDLDDEAMEFVDFAVDGAQRMQKMIQALLHYSRVGTHGDPCEPTDVGRVFEQVVRNLGVTIEESDATVDVPDDLGTVAGDESQLVQLFQNLVENGIKYSESDPHVAVSVQRRDGFLEYAITDDGIGMDPDQLDSIFEVFQRLHTRKEFDGTGIGLSICRKIVDRHDGEIRVESTPGDGSTFSVTLPESGETDE
jgi:PAS domain S-box-containing protein